MFIFGIYNFCRQGKYFGQERVLLDVIDSMDCKLTVSKTQNVPDCECLQDIFPLIVYGKYLSLGTL